MYCARVVTLVAQNNMIIKVFLYPRSQVENIGMTSETLFTGTILRQKTGRCPCLNILAKHNMYDLLLNIFGLLLSKIQVFTCDVKSWGI